MRVRGRRLLPLLIALLVMAGAFCYGAVRTSGEMWSHLETGSVKIGIETLGLEHGTFRKLPQEVIVDCEKPVSYVPADHQSRRDLLSTGTSAGKSGRPRTGTGGSSAGYPEWMDTQRGISLLSGAGCLWEIRRCMPWVSAAGRMGFFIKKSAAPTEADALQAKELLNRSCRRNPWGDLVVTASQIEKGNLLRAVEPAGEELQEMEGSPCSITADQEKGLVLEEGAFFHILCFCRETAIESHQLSNWETSDPDPDESRMGKKFVPRSDAASNRQRRWIL